MTALITKFTKEVLTLQKHPLSCSFQPLEKHPCSSFILAITKTVSLSHSKVRVVEPLAVLSCAYLSYMLAELVSFSGGSILLFPMFTILLTYCQGSYHWLGVALSKRTMPSRIYQTSPRQPSNTSLQCLGLHKQYWTLDSNQTKKILNKNKLITKLHQFHHGLYHLPLPWDGRSWGCAGINLTDYPKTTYVYIWLCESINLTKTSKDLV